MPEKPRKVLILGSGPIVIGQAAEFDYAGTQACKAMHEEGITSVLINSNPATIMTDEDIADIVYIEPLTVEMITRIIEKERPDGLLPTLGGQTGLNLAMELADHGVLEKYNVRVLGTPITAIRKGEDRELFKKMLMEIGEPVPPSAIVTGIEQVRRTVEEIGFPVVIRPAYTLGGTGGGFAQNWEELERVASSGLAASPIHQVLVETSVKGWKEIEYEVMRDGANNCITICNMENVDPMGVHTGDSIVVAPSQTLTNKEHQMLRTASLKIVRALGVEGGCNIQMALNPSSDQYYVIEVNPRLSRSSALASKATGYPIARVAAKIAIGKRLDEIPNAVTGKTMASFEPSLDYIVVKIPRWPFDKFASGDRIIGTQMKATGEVMAIDRTFEAAFQKAVRCLEFGKKTLLWEDSEWKNGASLEAYPLYPNDLRLWAIMAAIRRNLSLKSIHDITCIDMWFLEKLSNIVSMEKKLLSEPLKPELLTEAKRMGFSDEQIATLADRLPDQVRDLRHQWNIRPVFKMVDTCAGEFDASTPYFYSTYEMENESIPDNRRKAIVIGSGPIRIGQGIEFDYCSVHSAWALQAAGYQSIMVNSNPETVSTDFDTSDRLYFEALDEESVRDIIENETVGGNENDTPGVIVQFGGQTAINLAEPLTRNGLKLLGSDYEAIDLAEDRKRFEGFLSNLGIPQAPGSAIYTIEEALKVAEIIGYPVLVRPSYVLGGRAMEIVHNASELVRYMKMAVDLQTGHPVLIDKYLLGKEVEIDAVSDGEDVLIPGIMEHIERAGVHSGDSMAVYPSINLTREEIDMIVDYSTTVGKALKIKGLMNIQFVVCRSNNTGANGIYILEVNPRASRTIPFISKVTGIPMVDLATRVMLGESLKQQGYSGGLVPAKKLFAIKAPVFSMSKLAGVDTYLGPEMKSTGEVMGVDLTFDAALAKALIASGMMLPEAGSILLSIADRDKPEALPIIRDLNRQGYRLYATEGTAAMIEADGMKVKMVSKKLGEGHPNIIDIIRNGTVAGVINTITGGGTALRDGFHIRRATVEQRLPCFTSLDTARAAVEALKHGHQLYNSLSLPEYRKIAEEK
ncbi:MAG: carbamoyl-phosphate synthase large subunit [Dehalococcoidales bacterium]|jgi:carbamoyl-phosphate synthase large subunit|nr:carbamoyl-phosphate synthase large subunit [Dehalococcoidales bacterium]MDD4465645.1 carbamoyl-phosphate synthase large subunit [Dehalococcoidales bacterium]MDD5402448.1 carbamoyl-phosphate synthase large subunit [Dehalococcoidales bacterium]